MGSGRRGGCVINRIRSLLRLESLAGARRLRRQSPEQSINLLCRSLPRTNGKRPIEILSDIAIAWFATCHATILLHRTQATGVSISAAAEATDSLTSNRSAHLALGWIPLRNFSKKRARSIRESRSYTRALKSCHLPTLISTLSPASK